MKRRTVLILVFLSGMGVAFAKTDAWKNKAPFNVGERLRFQVSWGVARAGYATMEVAGVESIGGRQCYHIVSGVATAPVFDRIFRVRNTYESWLDCGELLSRKFVARFSEGSYKKVETLLFDRKKQVFSLLESGRTGKAPASIQDVVSALYNLRAKPLAVGKSYLLDAQMGSTSWPLVVSVLYKEKISVPAGDFDCFVVRPLHRKYAGNPDAQGTILVWLSADEKKIPVRIDCQLPLGSLSVDLLEVNGI